MALTFPLSTANFADKLKITTVKWRLARWDQFSGLGSGDVIGAQIAPPRIAGEVTLAEMVHNEAAQVQALIESLDGPINSFYLYAPQKPYPQADPGGTVLGTSTPTIASIGANNKSMALEGLPAGYVLTVGDYLAFDYGTNPVRRAFHRIIETVTAFGSGVTPAFEVRPHFPPGVTAGPTVILKKPAAKVFIVPDSFDPGTSSNIITTGMSFQVMQRP